MFQQLPAKKVLYLECRLSHGQVDGPTSRVDRPALGVENEGSGSRGKGPGRGGEERECIYIYIYVRSEEGGGADPTCQ